MQYIIKPTKYIWPWHHNSAPQLYYTAATNFTQSATSSVMCTLDKQGRKGRNIICRHKWETSHTRLYFLFFILGDVVFLQEPMNVTVSEGMNAFFPCYYHGTTAAPTWRINSRTFHNNRLPPKHSYDVSAHGLAVSNVDLSMNMNSYSCYFSMYVGGGQFRNFESSTGFLIIAGLLPMFVHYI